MKKHRFRVMEDVKKNIRQELAMIQTDEFEQCFKQFSHRIDKYIKLTGEYIEKVKFVIFLNKQI